MKLSELKEYGSILADLKGSNKFQVIEELVDCLNKTGRIKDRDTAFEDVLDRERYLSTGLENGIAIPHGKTDAVDELIIAYGFHKEGIDFDSLDGKPAHLIFLVLSPKDTSGPHIQVLALISRNLKKPETHQKLMNAGGIDEIQAVLDDFS
jgi:fructose-specific phosphotransferase system IIA component